MHKKVEEENMDLKCCKCVNLEKYPSPSDGIINYRIVLPDIPRGFPIRIQPVGLMY